MQLIVVFGRLLILETTSKINVYYRKIDLP